jgi:RNA polymerase sigma factor (sigma-70 family)
MRSTTQKYDLDLSKIGDEELVVLAQECGFRPAVSELLLRYHQPMGRLIAHVARQTALNQHDVEDAQQNAVFALCEAIAGYDTLEMVKPAGCRFRSFARLVTTRRFWDFVKHVRRLRHRFHWRALADANGSAAQVQHRSQARATSLPPDRLDDAAEAAAHQEDRRRLQELLDCLDGEMRALWQELASGKKLRQISDEWGLSYDAVKRQRRKLLTHIAVALRVAIDPELNLQEKNAFFLPRLAVDGE